MGTGFGETGSVGRSFSPPLTSRQRMDFQGTGGHGIYDNITGMVSQSPGKALTVSSFESQGLLGHQI